MTAEVPSTAPRSRLALAAGRADRWLREHDAHILSAVGAALVLALGFETLPAERVQILPLTSVLAVVLVPLALRSLFHERRSPVLRIVLAFAIWAVAHSVAALAVEAVAGDLGRVRVVAWLRQVASLYAGVAVFLVLRLTLAGVARSTTLLLAAASGVPGVVLALVNVAWGVLRDDRIGYFVREVRALVVPQGFSYHDRAAGLCFEPSHFAVYLAIIVLPALVGVAIADRERRVAAALAGSAALVAFGWAYSFTGILVLAAVVGGMLVTARGFRPLVAAAGAVALVATAALVTRPHNYLAFQLRWLVAFVTSPAETRPADSVSVPFYGSLGPFLRLTDSWNVVGHGLGGTATHLAEILPAEAGDVVTRASWAGMPSLTTSLGRVFAETGLVGLALFCLLWVVALRALGESARCGRHHRLDTGVRVAVQGALAGLAVAHAVKLGSFALPYLWFWLAVVDVQWCRSRGVPAAGPGGDGDATV